LGIPDAEECEIIKARIKGAINIYDRISDRKIQ